MKAQLILKKLTSSWPKVKSVLIRSKLTKWFFPWSLHYTYYPYISCIHVFIVYYLCAKKALPLLCADASWYSLLCSTLLNYWIISYTEQNPIISLSSFLQNRYIFVHSIRIINAFFFIHLTKSSQFMFLVWISVFNFHIVYTERKKKLWVPDKAKLRTNGHYPVRCTRDFGSHYRATPIYLW